jgi:hypothetical protein
LSANCKQIVVFLPSLDRYLEARRLPIIPVSAPSMYFLFTFKAPLLGISHSLPRNFFVIAPACNFHVSYALSNAKNFLSTLDFA